MAGMTSSFPADLNRIWSDEIKENVNQQTEAKHWLFQTHQNSKVKAQTIQKGLFGLSSSREKILKLRTYGKSREESLEAQ